jgi:septal ring factor EnvC (AmiA/AmiB activator)
VSRAALLSFCSYLYTTDNIINIATSSVALSPRFCFAVDLLPSSTPLSLSHHHLHHLPLLLSVQYHQPTSSIMKLQHKNDNAIAALESNLKRLADALAVKEDEFAAEKLELERGEETLAQLEPLHQLLKTNFRNVEAKKEALEREISELIRENERLMARQKAILPVAKYETPITQNDDDVEA